ncbi:MAG: thioredoxin family protein [Acidobacteriota bacterium]
MNPSRARTRVSILATLVLGLAPVHSSWAQEGPISDFQASGEYLLEVDGKAVPKAEIFQSTYASAFLILTSELPAPVRINVRAQTVEAVNLMKVAKQPDGAVTLLPDSTLQPLGTFQFADENVVFAFSGKTCKLKPRPALLGLHVAADLKGYKPEYLRNEARYTADAAVLQVLKTQAKPARVRVFFGSWCPHCTAFVPNIFKVEDGIQGSAVRFEYYGLPREGMAAEPEARKLNINSVPTGVVFDPTGKEIGRITGEDWRKPEDRLRALLVASPAPK